MTSEPAQFRPWLGAPPRTEPPAIPGFHLIAHERCDIARLSIIGLALIPLWSFLLAGAIGAAGGRASFRFSVTPQTALLGVAVALVCVPVAHELLHGVAIFALGHRPRFGLGAGFAYTTMDEPLSRPSYLLVTLTPLIVISALAIALGALWNAGVGWLLFAGIVNASGAVGDLWMSWRAARYPRGARYVDLADGFAVLAPEPR